MNERRAKPSFASLLHRARGDESVAAELPVDAPLRPARVRDEWAYEAMQFMVDPSRVRIWPGSARDYADLNADNCRDLIESITREGMQKVAAIVRPVFDDESYEYEILSGSRRHFAVAHLRGSTMPDLRLLVQVEILDDEGAFRLAELENRARLDVSDIERARSYATALSDYYGGDIAALARRIAQPEDMVERMVRIAGLPDAVIAAFGAPGSLSLEIAEDIGSRLDGPTARVVLAVAGQIARAQAGRRDDGLPPYSSAEVLRLLDGAAIGEPAVAPQPVQPVERLSLAIVGATAETLTIRLDAGHAIEPELLARIVKSTIDGAAAQGVDIRWNSET